MAIKVGVGCAVFALLLAACASTSSDSSLRVGEGEAGANNDMDFVAYFPEWGVYSSKYYVRDIPASSLSAVNYAFATFYPTETVNGQGDCKNLDGTPVSVPVGTVAPCDAWADWGGFSDASGAWPGYTWAMCDPSSNNYKGAICGSFGKLIELKKANPNLKTIISIGGWTLSLKFSEVAADSAKRKLFADSAAAFASKYQFDGVDIDWEFPVEGGVAGMAHSPSDKGNFTLLLQEVRNSLNAQGQKDAKTYQLTAALSGNPNMIKNIEVTKVADLLDYANLMTYDSNGAFGTVTAFNAPLSPDNAAPDPWIRNQTVESAVDAYVAAGMPKSKINVGLPYYGRSMGQVATNNDGLYQAFPQNATGPGNPGQPGMINYKNLAPYLSNSRWTQHTNSASQVPWLWNSETSTDPNAGSSGPYFITYDDPTSIATKTKYAQSEGLGGVMVWDLSGDTDDYTLTNAVLQAFGRAAAEKPAPLNEAIAETNPTQAQDSSSGRGELNSGASKNQGP